MKIFFMVVWVICFSITTLVIAEDNAARESRLMQNITGLGDSNYFNVMGSSASVIKAYRQDAVRYATRDSINTLSSICTEWGGIVDESTLQSTITGCELTGPEGSLRAQFHCRVDTTANCLL
jgi:hypothetical protein